MRVHQLRLLAAGVVVGALTTWAPWGTSGHAADAAENPCGSDSSPVAGQFTDVNDDGLADLLVGMPGATVHGMRAAGAVDVRFGKPGRAPFDGPDALIHLAEPRAGDRFGATVAVGDLDGDCDSDAVPGLDAGGATDAGGVVVLTDPDDFHSTDLEPLPRPGLLGLPQPREHLGAALDLRPEDLGRRQAVVVGAPDATVDGADGAGRVVEFALDPTTDRPDPSTVTSHDQSQQEVPGEAQPGAHFGAAVRAGSQQFVIVGAPGYPVAERPGAGAVAFLHVPTTDSHDRSCLRTEDSPHVPGRANRGDHLGAALGPYGFAGAPGEDVGHARAAGAVYLFSAFCGLQQPGDIGAYRETQDTRGFSDRAEAGDHFGAVLAARDTLIGTPGEDVGRRRNAGIVQNWYGGDVWRPGRSGFRGLPAGGARFGSAILHAPTEQFRWKYCSDMYCQRQTYALVIGAPGHDHGRGAVYVSRSYVLRPPSEPRTGAARFGAGAASTGSG